MANDNHLKCKNSFLAAKKTKLAASSANATPFSHPAEIATVSVCLTEHHTDCQGGYSDFSESYFIKCDCPCHSKGEE